MAVHLIAGPCENHKQTACCVLLEDNAADVIKSAPIAFASANEVVQAATQHSNKLDFGMIS